jgi:hypothetical protein
MAQDAMSWHRGRVLAFGFDQLAAPQQFQCGLDRALRQAGFFGKHSQAGLNRPPSRAGASSIKREINKIGSGLAIMTDDVAHQNVEDVIVVRDRLAKSRHGKK